MSEAAEPLATLSADGAPQEPTSAVAPWLRLISAVYREDEWEYPEEVLREVLVNALVHRDYSEFAQGMQVQVELYPDRLTVRNPGGLYGPVELTALGDTTISSSRNRARWVAQ